MSDNVHKNHRARVRREFLQNGFNESTPPHKILELLLFYCIPQKDTNEIAHELLNRFGSIRGVLDAPVEELVKVKGISYCSATLLKLVMPVARAYMSDNGESKKFPTSDELGEYLKGKYLGLTKETLAITSLAADGKLLGFDIISEGDNSAVELSFRKIIETVMKRNPDCVVMSHNHPNSTALPSKADEEITKRVADLLESINIILADHIIISSDDYVSMAQSRRYADIFRYRA